MGVLAFAVVRPRGLPEATVAVPAAVLVVAVGAVSWPEAREQVGELLPVVGFLAAILVLAQLCADEGLFRAAGDWVARACRGQTGPLLGGVFAVASIVTAVLSLDATVVLLTPVVLATAARVGARPRPYVYACAHLANSASLLLPVSNLTNLLAFTASGLSFTRFAALMALPWLAAIAVEYAVFRRAFRADLAAGAHAPDPGAERTPVPVFTLVVLALTLAGFVVTSFEGASRSGRRWRGLWYWPSGRWPSGRPRRSRSSARPTRCSASSSSHSASSSRPSSTTASATASPPCCPTATPCPRCSASPWSPRCSPT